MQPQQTPPVPEPAAASAQPAPFAVPGSVAAPASAQAAPAGVGPALADDGDLIEKEWVAKVKQLTTSLAGDPFALSQQYASLRADYLQKRYGKVINTKE